MLGEPARRFPGLGWGSQRAPTQPTPLRTRRSILFRGGRISQDAKYFENPIFFLKDFEGAAASAAPSSGAASPPPPSSPIPSRARR